MLIIILMLMLGTVFEYGHKYQQEYE